MSSSENGIGNNTILYIVIEFNWLLESFVGFKGKERVFQVVVVFQECLMVIGYDQVVLKDYLKDRLLGSNSREENDLPWWG